MNRQAIKYKIFQPSYWKRFFLFRENDSLLIRKSAFESEIVTTIDGGSSVD